MTVFLDPVRRISVLVHDGGGGELPLRRQPAGGPETFFLGPERVPVLIHRSNPEVLSDWRPEMAGQREGGGEPLFTKTYVCRGGCGRRRTFVGFTEKLLGLQIASAGWKVDGCRGECPSCWMEYEASVVRAARGNT